MNCLRACGVHGRLFGLLDRSGPAAAMRLLTYRGALAPEGDLQVAKLLLAPFL
jgi:hypothetical protein